MSRFVGENLNKSEIAALQAVSYNAGGAQFGLEEKLIDTIKNHRECRVIEDISPEELILLLDKLVAECLIERKKIKDKPCVGLTDDGRRCNLISTDF